MAIDEGKSIMRRPMSQELKQEREEFVARCYIAMKDYGKVIAGETPGKVFYVETTVCTRDRPVGTKSLIIIR